MRTCLHTCLPLRSALQVLRDVLAKLFPDLEQQLAPLKDTLDLFARADTVCALLHELPFPVSTRPGRHPPVRLWHAAGHRWLGPFASVPSAV
jgi:hypothetical protein